MQMHMGRWLLAALLLSAICCSAADDAAGGVETANFGWYPRVDTTICTTYTCPAGQYATSATTCQPCPPGTFKAAANRTCCESCRLPEQTFSNNTFTYYGATGCGCPKGTYKATYSSYKFTFSVCRRCASDSVAEMGSTTCTACVAPKTPSIFGDKCVDPCPAGTMNWQGTCLNCTEFYKPAANPTPGGVCIPCKDGATTTTGVTCDKCLDGYHNSGNATDAVCNTCAANYYNPRFWSWHQQQLKRAATPDHFYYNYGWPILCRPCPSNSFSPDDNKQARCCPANKTYQESTNRCV